MPEFTFHASSPMRKPQKRKSFEHRSSLRNQRTCGLPLSILSPIGILNYAIRKSSLKERKRRISLHRRMANWSCRSNQLPREPISTILIHNKLQSLINKVFETKRFCAKLFRWDQNYGLRRRDEKEKEGQKGRSLCLQARED